MDLGNYCDFFVGKIILRLGGRKSISQMTITQTIVMIGIGSLLIQPIAEENIMTTLLVALVFTILMVLTEYIESVSSMMDVKTATIEVSGQVGYELKD